jgi:hypothetical protein
LFTAPFSVRQGMGDRFPYAIEFTVTKEWRKILRALLSYALAVLRIECAKKGVNYANDEGWRKRESGVGKIEWWCAIEDTVM